MSLTNSQYDAIEREFDAKRLAHIRDMQAKLDRAYIQYPRLSGIDEEVVDLNMKRARARLGFSDAEEENTDEKLADLAEERKALLSAAGFKDGVIEPEYDCPICQDTGYVDGRKCICFINAAKKLIYSSSGIEEIISRENFDSFRLSFYAERIVDPDNGRTAREAAKLAYDHSKKFVADFGTEYGNIYFYGKTGVGKTFLAHCIAGALTDRGVNVCFVSETRLIEMFEESQFRPTDESKANVRTVLESDLLIIDDLGAVNNNSFVSSVLLRCIEERHLAKKSTVITSNLSIEDLQDRYSDRIFSRIYSYYKKLYLFGEDLRIRT